MTDDEPNAAGQSTANAAADCLMAFASLSWDAPAAGFRVKQVCHGGQRLRLIEFSEEFVETDW